MPCLEKLSKARKPNSCLLAQGASIPKWARANGVPKRTAYRWSEDPKVRAAANKCRRRALDRAVGRMAKRATWAVDQIKGLAKTASSDSVKLTPCGPSCLT